MSVSPYQRGRRSALTRAAWTGIRNMVTNPHSHKLIAKGTIRQAERLWEAVKDQYSKSRSRSRSPFVKKESLDMSMSRSPSKSSGGGSYVIHGGGRGVNLRGNAKKRKHKRSTARKSKEFKYKLKEVVKAIPPPNSYRCVNQTGSLGAPNVWTYRMDYFFNLNGALNSSIGDPMFSYQHATELASLVGMTFTTETQIRVLKAVDKYIIRAPTNTTTTLEVFVLQPKEPVPNIWDNLTAVGTGPLYDLAVDSIPTTVSNPGNIQPFDLFPLAVGFPSVPVGTAGGTTSFDVGISQLDFNPRSSQRFMTNYKIVKSQKFQIGPEDQVTFTLSMPEQVLKYEDYFLNAIGGEARIDMIKKSRFVMFRWHGELCQGTTTAAAGAYCNMGWSADNLLVRCERYCKVRKITQNINTVKGYYNKGGSGIPGTGNNLAATNASLKVYGEENNPGTTPGS